MRGFRDDDLDAWAKIHADFEVVRWIGRERALDRDEAWRELAYLAGHWSLRGCGQWALEERSTGELVGRAGLYHPEGWPGLEVGWTLGRRHWGRGLATEAGAASIAWAFSELGAAQVISLIAPSTSGPAGWRSASARPPAAPRSCAATRWWCTPSIADRGSARLGRVRTDAFCGSARLGRVRTDAFCGSARLGRVRTDAFCGSARLGRVRTDAFCGSARLGRVRTDAFCGSARLGRVRTDAFCGSARLGRVRTDAFRQMYIPPN